MTCSITLTATEALDLLKATEVFLSLCKGHVSDYTYAAIAKTFETVSHRPLIDTRSDEERAKYSQYEMIRQVAAGRNE